jgi:hypothetical protein
MRSRAAAEEQARAIPGGSGRRLRDAEAYAAVFMRPFQP